MRSVIISERALRVVLAPMERYYAEYPEQLACSDPLACKACTFLELRALRDQLDQGKAA